MQRERVKSSVIRSIGYDPKRSILEVEFHTGRLYRYFRVPPEEVTTLLTSDSIGGHFNHVIRQRYRSREIFEDPTQTPMRLTLRTEARRAKSRR